MVAIEVAQRNAFSVIDCLVAMATDGYE